MTNLNRSCFFILIFAFALILPQAVHSQCELVINDPPTVCEGLTVDLTLPAITEGSSNNLTFTYWKDTTAETIVGNPLAVDSSGIYFIKAEGLGDCELILPVKVTIVDKPNLVKNNPSHVCAPATVDLTAEWITRGSDPGLTLTYWIDASGTRPLTIADRVPYSGTYYIKAVAEGGCLSFKPVVVTIYDGFDFEVKSPLIACAGDSVDLTLPEVTEGTDSLAILSYWTDPLATTELTDPQSVKLAGTYYIRAFIGIGCVSVAPVEVEFVDPYAELDLAIVSVDSESNKNILYWNPPENDGTEYVNIYKKNYH